MYTKPAEKYSEINLCERTKLRILKAILVLSNLIIGVVPLLPTINQYEVSLYTQIPFVLRVGAGIIVFVSIIACITALLYGRNRLALYALAPLLTLSALFPFLPKSLGYIVKFGDAMSHAGIIRDILSTGTKPDVIYPGLHIIATALVNITGLSATLQLDILSTATIVLFSLTSLLLARYSNIPAAAVLLFIPIAYAPGSVSPSKFTWATLFPLVIFLSFRLVEASAQRRRLSVVVLPLTLVIWLSHPVPAVTATVSLALVAILAVRQRGLPRLSWSKAIMLSACLSTLFGYLWMGNTSLLKRGVAQITIILVPSRAGPEQVFSRTSLLTTLFDDFGLSPIDVVTLVLRDYGGVIVVCLFSGIGVILYLSDLGPRAVPERYRIPTVISVLVIGAGLWSGAEFTAGIIPSFSFQRALRPAIYIGVVASGSVVYVAIIRLRHLLDREGGPRLRISSAIVALLIICILLFPIIGATMTVYESTYYSPDTAKANHQILPSDLNGMNWYFNYKDRNIKTVTLWRLNFRYVSYLLSPTEETARYEELDGRTQDTGYRAPAHFGYQNNTLFAQRVGCRYYIEGKFDRSAHVEARPSNKFTNMDFRRLKADPTVQRVYSNGNLNISKVSKC